MRVANLISSEEVYRSQNQVQMGGNWYVARPIGFVGIFLLRRIKLAWGVFIGKYDALKWEKQ